MAVLQDNPEAPGKRRESNVSTPVNSSIPTLLLVTLAACSSGPPDFSLESAAVPIRREGSRSISIGSLATPPPGDYRFVRMDADGVGEVRELQAVNGPGPWLEYVGRVAVPASVAREAFATIDAAPPASAPGDNRAPCVLAFESAPGQSWQGCAYPGLAERVLSQVPRLTAPGTSPDCRRPACQVRLLTEVPAFRHELTGRILQDIVLDHNGTFWCASAETEQRSQANTLRVERGAISPSNAGPVFEWLTAGAGRAAARDQSSRTPESVMTRGRGADWGPLSRSDADAVRRRWQRLADRLPVQCRTRS
jgi:hypothetical protein